MSNSIAHDRTNQQEIEIVIPEDHFTRVSNQSIRDKRLKHSAFRLLCWIASHSGTFKTTYKSISKQMGLSEATIASSFKQLDELGYMHQTKTKKKNGFNGAAKKTINWIPPVDNSQNHTLKNEVCHTSKNEVWNTLKIEAPKNNNLKEEKNKEVIYVELFNYWVQKSGKTKAKLTPKRKKKIQDRLKEYPPEYIKQAIDGCMSSPYHMGDNDTGTLYNDIELICRSGEKLESFAERMEQKAKPKQRQSVYDFMDKTPEQQEAEREAGRRRAYEDELKRKQEEAQRNGSQRLETRNDGARRISELFTSNSH